MVFSADEVQATVGFLREESEVVMRSSPEECLEVLLEALGSDGEGVPQSFFDDPREAYTRLRIQAKANVGTRDRCLLGIECDSLSLSIPCHS